MSNISNDDVIRLAKLSRLRLTDDEVKQYQKELTAIFKYVEMLQNIDTEGIEPSYQVTGLHNVFRPDELIDYGVTPKDLLKNAPDTEGDYLKVKRMIG